MSKLANEDFQKLALRIRARKRQRRRRSWLGAGLLIALPFAAWGVWTNLPGLRAPDDGVDRILAIPETEQQGSQEDFELAATDSMRDPLFLVEPSGQSGGAGQYEIRFQNAQSATQLNGKVFYVADRMASASAQLATALPATPQDFALLNPDTQVADGTTGDSLTTINRGMDDGAGWEGSPSADGSTPNGSAASESEIIGSSTLVTIEAAKRLPGPREVIVKAAEQRPIQSIIADAGVPAQATEAAVQATATYLNQRYLHLGSVAVLLLDRSDGAAVEDKIVSLAIVDDEGQAGAIRITANDTYERVDDPEVAASVLAYVGRIDDANKQTRLRLMDGLYAAGVRNGVPPTIMSETVMQMARGYDLGEFMQPEDRFTLIYSDKPRDAGRDSGHVLYAAINKRGGNLVCYVLKPGIDRDFTCMTEKDTVTQQLGPTGFVTPVNGVLSSGYGPRMHPILQRVRTHQGVDWAAPPGTPINAAFNGTIAFVGQQGGFGNFVRIQHPDGVATGYAHMSAFAEGLKAGQQVKAGELIGYVGTTGLSTGPHLHFELYVDGAPVDPFNFETQVAAGPGGAEKDKLIGRIIHVESAGNASAQNPLSSATGLGQFLSGTWMRMIRSYRPDLASSMSQSDILALRFDPTISREMLYHFASENESDLRRAGQQATAGNLYLAHFLGSGGAISVLRAAPDEPVGNVVGYGVVSANPFLSGKDAQWVVNWAAKKMSGATTYLRRRLPPEVRIKNSRFAAYSGAIDRLLQSIQENKPG